MPRSVRDETPAYAAEAIASARVNGSGLAVSSGLFVMLLVAMSLIETPIQRWDVPVREGEEQPFLLVGPPLGIVSASRHDVGLIANASRETAAQSGPRCLTAAPETLSAAPGSAARRAEG